MLGVERTFVHWDHCGIVIGEAGGARMGDAIVTRDVTRDASKGHCQGMQV